MERLHNLDKITQLASDSLTLGRTMLLLMTQSRDIWEEVLTFTEDGKEDLKKYHSPLP